MTGDEDNLSSGDDRLNQVIAAYLEAVEAGSPPDRQELLEQHVELAAELTSFFTNHDRIQQPTGVDSEAPTTAPGQPEYESPTIPPSGFFRCRPSGWSRLGR